MAEISCIYFLFISLYAIAKFVSKGTVISTILLRFFSVFQSLKGQLQRFYKLISNDRIWPSEHGFEVVFEISAFKVRNKRGIHSRFHSFSENINRETFVGDVTSDQSSMISTQRSDLTWLQSKWKLPRLTAFGRNYGLLCCL